ncbi:MAG: YicC/YloC family endoribonuclease [Desulfurispora sp.]|uniref:YicC/YloC family endoribonuclease n=1 Tax=Desulfurispora sp. TaxID=3014275 RepID=UPI00404A1774
MPYSMTGYGRGEASGCGKKFVVELKTVNHRYVEVHLRFPRNFNSLVLEERARRMILQTVARGRVDGYISVEDIGEKNAAVQVDKELAAAYYKAMRETLTELGISSSIEPEHLFSRPGVLSLIEPEVDVEELWGVLETAVRGALEQLLEMRRVEGDKLRADLLQRLDLVAGYTREIQARSPLVVDEYRQRLEQRLAEILPDNLPDQQRLMQEVALYAERCSITEELVRLFSHLEQARVILNQEGTVGRKMDFLLQEMNREVNTIGSKSSDLPISRTVVEIKSELEKIREQVQNLE